MGTYTTNYNLFMPTVGEQGWGELVNRNFSTIDTTMAGLNTRMGTAETTIASNVSRIGTLETKTDAIKEKTDNIEIVDDGAIFNGDLSGKIIINNVSTNENNLKLYSASFDNPSVGSTWVTAGVGASSNLTCSTAIIEKFNASIFKYSETASINGTCTITVNGISQTNGVTTSGSYVITVTNTSTGEVVHSTTLSMSFATNSPASKTTTFIRNSMCEYTINIRGASNYNSSYSVSTNTPTVYAYA